MKRFLIIILTGLLFCGCERYLEETPQNRMNPSTTDDYDQLLNRAYITKQIMPYLDVLGDDVELIASNQISDGAGFGDFVMAAYMWEDSHEVTMGVGDLAFEKLYESIFYTNLVADNVGNAIGVELDDAKVEATRRHIRGEALVLRAYSYFYLVNLYGAPYDPATADQDFGVPINLSVAAEDKAFKRNTVGEVYSRIIDDLTEGIKLMEENPMKKASKAKFNTPAAKAFLARVYLYMQEWDLAIQYASEVVRENSDIFNLRVVGENLTIENNTTNYWDKYVISGPDYLGKANDNVIFVNGANELIPALSYWPLVTTFSVNRELGELYEPEDLRRLYFMATFNFQEEPKIMKLSYAKNRHIALQAAISESPLSGYTRVIRIEEMLLIIAEANARKATPDIGAAVNALNTLREPKFRQGKYTPLDQADFNQQSLIEYVALERRRELCFEGHRWFDLRRTTRPAMQRTGYENKVATLKQNDPKYTLQIPLREIGINPEIGLTPR